MNVTFRCIAIKNSGKGYEQVQVFSSLGPGWVQWEGGGEVKEVREANKCSQVLSHPP